MRVDIWSYNRAMKNIKSQQSHSSQRLGKPITITEMLKAKETSQINLQISQRKFNSSLKYGRRTKLEEEYSLQLNVKFSSEKDLKSFQDFLYKKSKQGGAFTGLIEAITNEQTITTAIHNIKSNTGSKTSGIDKVKIDKYLQMPKQDLIKLIQKNIENYKPKPVRRLYIKKRNGKLRPLGIPTILDRIIQECIRLIIEPICEAKFYPHSYGFRPYRAQKHAIRDITNIINASCRSNQQPIFAVEGDIKSCFDNINHRILIDKIWNIGIHDKRLIKIISLMLKVGYMEKQEIYENEVGTSQGSILSPLLANIYLNDFDWYIGRKYYEPVQTLKSLNNDRRKLRWNGVIPKFNIRFADDWVILTSTENEAIRLKGELTKYFKYRLKLELSEEKTKVTDLRKDGIKFLGYIIKAEKPRRTPADKIPKNYLVGKPRPDMERVSEKVKNICETIRTIKGCPSEETKALIIMKVNSKILGLAEYLKFGISSKAFHTIDRRVNNSCLSVWQREYPKSYNQMQVPLQELANLKERHEGHISKTFAIRLNNKWIGITMAFLTHIKYEAKPFNKKMTPYTEEGRRIYINYRNKHKPLPQDRPTLNDENFQNNGIYNFEFYMNREYAYNRDKGKCRCCGKLLLYNLRTCHHINISLPIEDINKVSNLAWVCNDCHEAIHNEIISENIETKLINKITKFQCKLKVKSVSKN